MSMFKHGHSVIKSVDHSKYLEIKIIPALLDNYMYLVIDRFKKEVAVVDPVEPERIKEVLEEEEFPLRLTAAFITHHHWDHAGGNNKILRIFPDLQIYAGDDRTEAMTKLVKDRQVIKFGNLTVCCMSTPCHTSGHMSYYVTGNHNESPALFCGDSLFISGCGKFFEGTAQQTYENMQSFSIMPPPTRVYCGHEYTVTNLKFAGREDPANQDLAEKLLWAQKCRANAIPTVPSTIADERQFNPFMRATNAAMVADLRGRRNRFKSKEHKTCCATFSDRSDRSGTTSASSGISCNDSC